MSASLCKVGPKAVPADVLHLMFVRQRRNGALWVFLGKLFPEEDKVCEAPADAELGALERLEVGLSLRVSGCT